MNNTLELCEQMAAELGLKRIKLGGRFIIKGGSILESFNTVEELLAFLKGVEQGKYMESKT